jgi:hypothetical protein
MFDINSQYFCCIQPDRNHEKRSKKDHSFLLRLAITAIMAASLFVLCLFLSLRQAEALPMLYYGVGAEAKSQKNA